MLTAKLKDWRVGDANEVLQGSVIVGRASILVNGIVRKNGIVVEKEGRRWAFYWDNPNSDELGRYVIIPLEENGSG